MIQLTKKLALTADNHSYIVGEVRRRPGRPDEIREPKYYSTAVQAVQGALTVAMRQGVEHGSITTLRQFIQEQEQQQANLERLIAPLKGGKATQEWGKGRLAGGKGNYTPTADTACTPNKHVGGQING